MKQLGYLAWWHLGGVQLTPAELRARLVAAGFPLPLRRMRPHTRLDSLSRLVVQAVEHVPGAVGVRPEGGLVFAPRVAYPDLDRLRTALAGLPTADAAPAGLYVLAMASTSENRAVLAANVTAGLLQDVAALERDLRHLQTKSTLIRPHTIDDRLTRLRTLEARAQLHETLLSAAQRQAVTAVVAALAQRLNDLRVP